jgi:hypothetical protein
MKAGRHLARAIAKAELVRLYNSRSFGWGGILAAKEAFISEYNRPDGSYRKFFDVIGPVSFQSLERWKFKLERSAGDPSCLIDKRCLRSTRKRRRIRRMVSRIIRLITSVPPQTRGKWFQFVEGLKQGKTPDEIAAAVGVSIYTVHRWTSRLAEF